MRPDRSRVRSVKQWMLGLIDLESGWLKKWMSGLIDPELGQQKIDAGPDRSGFSKKTHGFAL